LERDLIAKILSTISQFLTWAMQNNNVSSI
jgi:hypothetical protein